MSSTRNLNTTPSSTPEPPATSNISTPSGGNVPQPDSTGGGGGGFPLPSKSLMAGAASVMVVGGIIAGNSGVSNPISDFLDPQSSYIADGPFSYRFTKGEVLNYQLDSRVAGKGFDMGVGSDIGLTMDMGFSLETLSIDSEGNGTLQLVYDEVTMTGNFMGDPVNLYQSDSYTQMGLNKFDQLDTNAGDSIKGIPQLEFFKEPIVMEVAPNGHVNDVQGAPGFDLILSPSNAMAPSQFPSSQLEIGDSWNSEFNLPVPGLAVPASANTYNAVVDYETIGDRYCAVIRQEILSVQTDGQLNSPSSVLGEEMGFTMPTFEVSGVNMIWFDVNEGKLVRTDMNLFFRLEIGEQLEQVKSAIGGLSDILRELENPDQRRKKAEEEDSDPLLDMGVEIVATLMLVN